MHCRLIHNIPVLATIVIDMATDGRRGNYARAIEARLFQNWGCAPPNCSGIDKS